LTAVDASSILFQSSIKLIIESVLSQLLRCLKLLICFLLHLVSKLTKPRAQYILGGVALNIQETISQSLVLPRVSSLLNIWGVPLSAKKLTVMQSQPLVKKIVSRIENWSSKLSSYARRLQLIKSVLFDVQTYWSQVFVLPQKVLKLIQTVCRVFLWTGKSGISKRALIAWEHICLPKLAGGWNVIDLKCWNQAVISKQLCNLSHKKDVLWVKWVHEYYIKGRDMLLMVSLKHKRYQKRAKKVSVTRGYQKETKRYNHKVAR